MKRKKGNKIYLTGAVLSVAALAMVSMGIVNAGESIQAEQVSVQKDGVFGENPTTISTGQITTGEETDQDHSVSYTTNENVESSPIVETWVPRTEEEKRYYSYVGTETLAVRTDSVSGVKVANSVQGPLCQKVFESVLGDYSIGRTYNFFPGTSNLNAPISELDKEIEITMEIPKSLQKEGRSFEMICVSKGQPHVLEDLSKDGSSITFRTRYFYAFALCYKD